jgi:hypothetical protein
MKPTWRSEGRRGSALVAVLLVILVLTVVGLGVAYFAQVEDSLTGNARTLRAAFFVAETGLRKGELVLQNVVNDKVDVTTLLTCGACATPPLPPTGFGWPWSAVILNYIDPEDLAFKEFSNVVVPLPGNVVDRGTYSIYIRNNSEDEGGAAVDKDKMVVLVSVGQIRGLGGRFYTKILEEEIATGTLGGEGCTQVGCNPGSTNSALSGQ